MLSEVNLAVAAASSAGLAEAAVVLPVLVLAPELAAASPRRLPPPVLFAGDLYT